MTDEIKDHAELIAALNVSVDDLFEYFLKGAASIAGDSTLDDELVEISLRLMESFKAIKEAENALQRDLQWIAMILKAQKRNPAT